MQGKFRTGERNGENIPNFEFPILSRFSSFGIKFSHLDREEDAWLKKEERHNFLSRVTFPELSKSQKKGPRAETGKSAVALDWNGCQKSRCELYFTTSSIAESP